MYGGRTVCAGIKSCTSSRILRLLVQLRLSKKPTEQDGGKEDSVKGTQEGFLSRAITRPQATDFGCEPKSGSPGNTVAGTTQEGFLSRAITRRTPRAFPRRCAAQAQATNCGHRPQFASACRKTRRVFRQAEAGRGVTPPSPPVYFRRSDQSSTYTVQLRTPNWMHSAAVLKYRSIRFSRMPPPVSSAMEKP